MAEFLWNLQSKDSGGDDTVIAETDIIQFAGDGFDSKITVNAYNDSTHVKTSIEGNKSDGNVPNNVKFISQDGGTAGKSQADWGDGTEDLDDITNAEATLKVNFSDASSVATTDAVFYAYNGSDTATAPANIDVRVAEVGDENFTEAEGSASALGLGDQGAATSHDYFIAVSSSPLTVGKKTAYAFRIELTYS